MEKVTTKLEIILAPLRKEHNEILDILMLAELEFEPLELGTILDLERIASRNFQKALKDYYQDYIDKVLPSYYKDR